MRNPERYDEIADTEWAEAKAEASLLGMRTSDYLWGHLKRGERMATLMELSGNYRLLLDAMEDAGPEEMQTFEDTLESVLAEIEDKADACYALIKRSEGHVKLLKEESEKLSQQAKGEEAKLELVKTRLKEAMEAMGLKEIRSETHRFRIINNSTVPVVITGTVPPEYQAQKITVSDDKKKIGQALKDGVKLGFAHLGERGTHLRID